ncbi:MAG: hypothetical protein L0226_06385 [Acidobacteria bacterium]|nr:hypothetical protein [Acidobacteriota bacterium]MCI0661003.1 hypothetical protein [Acidobacteriota bacterium]
MSLEYAIEYPCEMRRQYGESTIRALARTGSLISRMVNETIEESRLPSAESIQFTTRFADDLEKAEQVASFCRTHCPANLGQEPGSEDFSSTTRIAEPIGCLGRIRYPIEARFERFLADRIQLLYDTVAPEQWPRLLHLLTDSESPFDGEGTKELRRVTTAEGLRFFEQRLPISLARKAARLTTDNLFDLLAGFSASDGGAAGYQRELPLMALSDYAEFLESLLINDLTEDERRRLHTQNVSYSQYVRFTQAIRLAEKLGVRLLMD